MTSPPDIETKPDEEGGRASWEGPDDTRLLPTGDESGTAPGDRRYRPDVEGLRAVAVVLVVFYHAGIKLSGGFVGVDVFFVISGFVITGLLLRERLTTTRTSLTNFYARRMRRILPAATIVILATVIATYVYLGFVSGNNTADDGRWASVFLANFHYTFLDTNYLDALRPTSPLLNFWTLSVEEQFYVVFPALFILAYTKGKLETRAARLTFLLGAGAVLSFGWSVIQTSTNPSAAYFSPFTRAWELALGALLAVNTPALMRMAPAIARLATWLGLAAIGYAAYTFTGATAYPGSAVAFPVLGAGLVIAGGTSAPRYGAELVLGTRPVMWMGKRSYSLYLWHFPVLVIALNYSGKKGLSNAQLIGLVVVALVASMITYRLVENPIRHSSLSTRVSLLFGVATILTTLVTLTILIGANSTTAPTYKVSPAANELVVERDVASATQIQRVPRNLEPAIAVAPNDWAGWLGNLYTPCAPTAPINVGSEQICVLGDRSSKHLMVVYGDSHAIMWLPALEGIANAEHWRLIVFAKYFCPASDLTVINPPGSGNIGGPYGSCNAWHHWVEAKINALRPDLVVISQNSLYKTPYRPGAPSSFFTEKEWAAGLTRTLQVSDPYTRRVVLGNIPMLPRSGPTCLSANLGNVQACSAPLSASQPALIAAERAAAAASGSAYIDPMPWFCTGTCTAIVAHYEVYLDDFHITGTYAKYLQNVLATALGFRTPESSSG